MQIKANGIEMTYELTSQGPCLVLIHGFSDNLTMWYNQIPAFSPRHQVLAYDVRGFGQTENTGPYSMELFAEDLYQLLGALNISKACVLGYSMGGRIGLEFALRHPDMTTGLVFANSGVPSPDMKMTPEQMAQMAERRQMMMDLIDSGDNEAISDAMAERSLSPGLREKKPEVFQRYKEVKLKNSPKAYKAIMEAMGQAMMNPPDLTQVACPALVIAGEHDGFMAVDVAQAMQKALKKPTLVILPTGHAAAVEAPEAFNKAVLDFMAGL